MGLVIYESSSDVAPLTSPYDTRVSTRLVWQVAHSILYVGYYRDSGAKASRSGVWLAPHCRIGRRLRVVCYDTSSRQWGLPVTPPACCGVSQDGIWWQCALTWLAWVNGANLIFTAGRYGHGPARRVMGVMELGSIGVLSHCGFSIHRLAELLDESWLACLPHRVAWRELVAPPTSLSCSTGVGPSVRFAQLLGGSWSDCMPRSFARWELVGFILMASGPDGPPQVMDQLWVPYS